MTPIPWFTAGGRKDPPELLKEDGELVLQQVILNLITNGVEAMSGLHQEQRELRVSTNAADTEGILVAIRDSGPGVDPSNFNRVFDSFYSTKPGGLGIGLPICRSIVEAHGGRLWARRSSPVARSSR